MNDENDVQRAWRYLRGFDVPVLTEDMRAEWESVIRTLTVLDFQRATQAARSSRPPKDLHLRPSPQAFLGYARTTASVDHEAAIAATQRVLAEQRVVEPAKPEHVAEVLAKTRAQLGVERKLHPDRAEVKAATLDEAKIAFRRYIESATDGNEESQAAIDAWRSLAAILGSEMAS
jgi:hypothetical protein